MTEQDAEERLKQQRDDLKLLNQVMRHDIRNDLQLVQAYAEHLTDHVDEEGQEYVELIKENSQSAVELMTTARTLAQVMLSDEAGVGSVSLDHVLGNQVESVQSSYPAAAVTIEGSIPAVTVRGDDMLGSVFRNLLQNAIHHNDKTPPRVEVSATATDEAVEVRVADNGPGVPESHRDEIFGQGNKGLDSPGAGIGLYLVQSLVETYGGDVWVTDNEPEGAVFVVALPLAED